MAVPESTLDEIDKKISNIERIVSSSPLHLSRPLQPRILSGLGRLRYQRYMLSNDDRDLQISNLKSTHAILLSSRHSTDHGTNTISLFFLLTRALFLRAFRSRQPSEIGYCIKYLRYLRGLPIEAVGIAHRDVTLWLVHSLAFLVRLEPENTIQDVEDMSILALELLASDLSEEDLKTAFAHFSSAILLYNAYSSSRSPQAVLEILRSANHVPQQVIECLREANTRLPDSQDISFVLSISLSSRFRVTSSNDDYEGAMALFDKIIASHSPADLPNKYVRDSLSLSATISKFRFFLYMKPEHLEEAIFRTRAHLNSVSFEDPKRGGITQSLIQLEMTRMEDFGDTNGFPEAHTSNLEVLDLWSPSSHYLIASLSELSAIESPSMMVEAGIRHLKVLDSMVRMANIPGIDEAVKYCRLLLTSLQQCPDDAMIMAHSAIVMSGKLLRHAFGLTKNPEYLDESIELYRGILKIPHAQHFHFSAIEGLLLSLMSRLALSMNREDYDHMMELFPIAVNDTVNSKPVVPDRFKIACQWARWARLLGHSSTLTAFEKAISLMQETLIFHPTLDIQHLQLVRMRDDIENLPLDYASYQVHIGQLTQAVETLERGRGLLWSEMRGLRTSTDQLRTADSCLAEKFTALSQDLEALTMSVSLNVWMNNRELMELNNDDGFDAISGHRVREKQKILLNERTSLLMQIRSFPGFENFSMAPSFKALHSAAVHGPVIVINHCKWRSDIIILLYNSPPSLITTPNDFFDRAKGLKDRLLAARKEGLDSTDYEDTLTSVLQTLYDLVGRPVIQRLQELNVPEQSRIWWCPTSVFCSLPLHAMGPIQSDGTLKLYFSDLYIPSYTPTLSALIESRKTGTYSFEKPSILLVAQPDEFMPGAWQEISMIQRLNMAVITLISEKATPSAVMNCLQDHRFAHFSCHGILETGKPFDASFKLYEGERLTLLEIIRSRLPFAEFAFLSACHTAELTEESISDEGLHLTAAVQYSGFRSVVGTMWAMADIDGQFLAKNFYESLFSDRWQGVPYYERAAEALRDSVQMSRRKKRVTTERWVNFVHYGA